MKKSSILVTLFLVVALVFAVSCPSGVTVSITGDKDISETATVDSALEAFTFEISTTGEFLSTAVNQELTIKGLENFSGSGDSAKATATAKIKTLGAADATSKKITTATVEVSAFTAKKATEGAKELTFAIPAVKSGETPKILKDVTTEVTITGKKVLITASNPVAKSVEIKASESSIDLTAGSSASKTVTFTLTNAKWKADASATIDADNGISFTVTRTSDTVMSLAISGNPTTPASAKAYSFDVTASLVDLDPNTTLPQNLKASVSITVKSVAAEKTAITITNDPADLITVSKAAKTATGSFTIAEGATWTSTVPTIAEADGLTFVFAVNSTDAKKLDLTITAGDSAVVSTDDGKTYEVTLAAANVTPDSTHKLAENAKLSFKVKITD